MKRVLIGVGHHNRQGGNQFEHDTNERKRDAVMALYRELGGATRLGFELRTYFPDEGAHDDHAYLPDLNRAALSEIRPDWRPDLLVEFHSEGVGNPNVAGAFVIYPDWGDDVDQDVRRHGRVFVDELRRQVPEIGVRHSDGPGLMSEKSTGVGIDGFRLGFFRDTAVYAEVMTRTIFEAGTHSNPRERAVMERADFPRRYAVAFLDGVARFFDATSPGWKKPAAPEYVAAELPRAAGGAAKWAEIVAAGRPVTIDGVRYEYERKRMVARRGAVCRAEPSDTAGKTRHNLVVKPTPEEVTVVLKAKIDGVNWRVTKYGTCLRASALGPVKAAA